VYALTKPSQQDSELRRLWWICQKYKYASLAVSRQYWQAYKEAQNALTQSLHETQDVTIQYWKDYHHAQQTLANSLQTRKQELLYNANLITLSVLDRLIPTNYEAAVEEYVRSVMLEEDYLPTHTLTSDPKPNKIYWEMGNYHKPHFTPEDCHDRKMTVCRWIAKDNLMSNKSLLAFETLDQETGEMRYFNIPLTLVSKETAIFCLLQAEPKPSLRHERHLFPRVLPDIDSALDCSMEYIQSGLRHIKKQLPLIGDLT
jgi:hypothetical protein